MDHSRHFNVFTALLEPCQRLIKCVGASFISLLFVPFLFDPLGVIRADETKQLEPIDVSGFRSGIHHWRNIRDENRFIQAIPGQSSFLTSQVREIVTNILLFQRDNGGWPKDYDMLAILTPDQREKVIETHSRNDTSYDNGNIHSQVEFLAKAFDQANEPEWRAACERGFDFMIRSQYENGGFPQRFPKPTSNGNDVPELLGMADGARN